MKKSTKNPYGTLDMSATNPQLKQCLVLIKDTTWHLYRSQYDSTIPIDFASRTPESKLMENLTDVQDIWANWENFDSRVLEVHARMQHELLFGFKAPRFAPKGTITQAIWVYRCAHAVSHISGLQQAAMADTPQARKSAIAGRRYAIQPWPKELKLLTDGSGIVDDKGRSITGKQGVKCWNILVAAAGEAKMVTEGELKQHFERRASEVTTKTDTVWRFFQFYRQHFVKARLVDYIKE